MAVNFDVLSGTLKLDTTPWHNALKGVLPALQSAQGSIQQFAARAKQSLDVAKNGFDTVAKAATGLVTAMAGAGIAATKLASDANEAASKFQFVFTTASDKTQKSLDEFAKAAQILERYFGSASTAPRAVFPMLLRLNRHHLRKIRDESPGFAFNLEEELEKRLAPFPGSEGKDPDFPAVLSLPEQGRFALGFYHQRAAYRSASADRKAAEAAST